MTGTTVRPAGVAGTSTGQTLSPLYVNSFRIKTVTSRLLAHVRQDKNTDKTEFCNLCISLARGIDYAVSNNNIPGSAPDLPYLIKQVCQRKNDLTSRAAIMVLMISVKSACSNGWFSEKIKEELYVLSNELQSSFCSVSVDELNSNVKNKESNLNPTITTIMSRFYPGMRMGKIFSLVETKPGYDSYVTDLHISKSSRTSPDDKLYLFVAQIDNIMTSSCLISPQQVSFLLNGEGVYNRTSINKDLGPQMPTHVTHMLKYGSNLLQVVGQFNGRYIIAIAFMCVVSNLTFSTIPDYIPPPAAQPDLDNEIIEGPSRISLKCPISFSRINIPVKGHSCKHLQCFDFNNYVVLNSRRPLWRCPHCRQSVCFHDIRIDQSMVKILKEVGEDVSHVKISGDGSWEAVTENVSDGLTEKPNENDAQPLNQETTTLNVDVMDLTENDNENGNFDEDDDRKPLPAGEYSVTNTNISPCTEDVFWRELLSSTLEARTNTRSDVSDAIQRNHHVFNSVALGQSQSQSQSQTPVSGNMHLHQNGQASPLSVDHFSSHQKQPLSQRAHLPVRSSGQADPHARLGGVGSMASLASSHSSQYTLAAIQRATSQINSPTLPIPPPIQTSGSSAEESWRPTGRMRGSLSGAQYAEALKNKFIIQPNEPVQAARAPPVLNTPRPFLPPHFQALMANNNSRPQAEGSGPGSDSSMASGAATGDN